MGLIHSRGIPKQLAPCRAAGRWVLGLLLLCLVAGHSGAQPAGVDQPFYFNKTSFHIPFHTEAGERRIRQVRLYVSEDQGATWNPVATALPQDGGFTYQSTHDGLYWFTVQTIDLEGRSYPQALKGAQPGLKVIVDTQAPTVTLRANQLQDGSISAEWQVRDENLKLESLRLEYHPAGYQWVPLALPAANAVGSHVWNPRTTSPVEVRVSVLDKAGNLGERIVQVGAVGNDVPGPAAGTQNQSNGAVKIVNSQQITLTYDIQEVGKSGIATVEVWKTRDGRSWRQDGAPRTVDARATAGSVSAQLETEGVYGFTLIARTNAGRGERSPQPGDQPQVWIEVDRTRPLVKVLNVDVARDGDATRLTITWNASDKNFDRAPITLFYSETKEGQRVPITTTPIENTGRYVWLIPADAPWKVLLHVDATDKAGNVGTASSEEVPTDLSQPKINVKGIEPGAKP